LSNAGRSKLTAALRGQSKFTACDREIGARVKTLRLFRRVTQSALAKRLGVSFQQVQKYELGANRISAGRLFQIAQVLNVEIGFFFEDIEIDVSLKAEPSPSQLTRGDIKFANAMADIKDARLRECIWDLIETLKSLHDPE